MYADSKQKWIWACRVFGAAEHCVFLLRQRTVATACGSATWFILNNRPRHMDTQDTEHMGGGGTHTSASQHCLFRVTAPGR